MSKSLLLLRRMMMAPPAPIVIPYQQVEYIDKVQGQYINTGIIPSGTTGILFDSQIINERIGASDNIVFGASEAVGFNKAFSMDVFRPSQSLVYFIHASLVGPVSVNDTGQRHLYKMNYMNSGVGSVDDDIASTVNLRSGAVTSIVPIWLGTYNANNGSATPDYGAKDIRIFRVQITDDTRIIADYYPVRDGSAGYLYEAKSGQLFGNDGTGGDFTPGPDII